MHKKKSALLSAPQSTSLFWFFSVIFFFKHFQAIWLCLWPEAIYKGAREGVLGLAVRCLNIGQEEAQCTGPSATRLCPEYTLWAEQQASGTCSVADQIKAFFTALSSALLDSLAQEVAQTPLSIIALCLPFFLSN